MESRRRRAQNERVLLLTARLTVRDVIPGDLGPLTDMWTDPEVERFMDDWGPRTAEAVPAWIEAAQAANRAEPRSSYNASIVTRADGQVVGWVGFGEGGDPVGDWNFGYALRPGCRGLGYARALVGVLAFCLGEIGLESVWGSCHPDNVPSAAVMAGAGMAETGPLPNGDRRFRADRSWSAPQGLAHR